MILCLSACFALKQVSFLSRILGPKTRSADFVAIVNIPGTESAPLLAFIREYSGMESFRNYFAGLSWVKPQQLESISCIFGPPTTRRKSSSTDTDMAECHPLEYDKTRQAWHHAAAFWMEQELANTNVEEIRVTSETFAMVRDPFDRLRSYFDVLYQGIHRHVWEEMNTDAQYRRVKEGDFHGWMELVFVEQEMPHGTQYHFIDDNVDKAISLITGKSPNVTVLMNECLEASLRVVENKLSFKVGSVDAFLRSQSNVSEKTNTPDLANQNQLRQRSKRYFPNEYKFYNAAVEQFKQQLLSLDASLLRRSCDI